MQDSNFNQYRVCLNPKTVVSRIDKQHTIKINVGISNKHYCFGYFLHLGNEIVSLACFEDRALFLSENEAIYAACEHIERRVTKFSVLSKIKQIKQDCKVFELPLD